MALFLRNFNNRIIGSGAGGPVQRYQFSQQQPQNLAIGRLAVRPQAMPSGGGSFGFGGMGHVIGSGIHSVFANNHVIGSGLRNPQAPLNIGHQPIRPVPLPKGTQSSVTPISLLQQVAHGFTELGASAQQAVTRHPVTLQPNAVGKFILGNKPIQSIQENSANTIKTHPGGFHIPHTPITLSPGQTGVANTILHLGADVPTALSVGKAGAKAAIISAKGLEKTGAKDAIKAVTDQIGQAPKPRVTTPEVLNPISSSKNPYTSTIRDVQPGDYAGARLAPQHLTQPIRVVAAKFAQSMNDLRKTNTDEYSNFWRHVEKMPTNASPELQNAAYWWREGTNRIHAHANALGKATSYIKDFALHPWELKNEEQLTPQGGAGVLAKHAIQRKYRTIAEGEQKAGLKLGSNPMEEGLKYLNGSSNALFRLTAKQALEKADLNAVDKIHPVNLGGGQVPLLSKEGADAAKGLEHHVPSNKAFFKTLRTGNVGIKSAILSYGQFHPFNISVLRAGPSLALAGHPIAAAKGVARTFRPLLPGGSKYVDRIITKAYQDGTIDKAAAIGMPYGEAGYNVAGTALKSGAGHRLVFEKQMPMMHDQVARSIIRDLEKRGVPLTSEEGRQAGIAGNATMGFINEAALNIGPRLRQAMSDFLLAGQFTPSKIVTLSKVGKGGVAGKYARTDVASNAVAALALVSGLGYVMGQKTDNVRDTILRALLDPSIPTPFHDSKGNNVEIGIPATYTGDIAKLMGVRLDRGADGHLHVGFNPPEKIPGALLNWARARLSPLADAGTSIAFNNDFGTKKLYDPGASKGTQAIQAATNIGTGWLPIGAQGLPYTKVVKDHVPGTVKDVLDANTPSTNPLLKSSLGSVGFRPRVDQSTGKGLDSNRFFTAGDEAKKGLASDGVAAVEGYIGSKKNSVTKKYEIAPTVWDGISKAATLLKADASAQKMGQRSPIDALIEMNQKIAKQGGKVDPLWKESKSHIVAYFQNQALDDPLSSQHNVWYNNNKSWYQPMADARSKFFNSLPKADPNKPAQPIDFPAPNKQVQGLKDQFFKITDAKQKSQFTRDHPELQAQFDKEFQYKNDVLTARGLTAYKAYPKATPDLQKYIDNYTAAGKAARKAIRNSNPKAYQNMVAFFDSVDLYNINKEGANNQLVGQPDQTSKQNKAIKSLASDIYQNADGSYKIVPAGWMQGLGGGGSGSSGGSSRGSGGSGGGSKKSSIKGASVKRSSSGSSSKGLTPNQIAKITGKVANPYKYAVGAHVGGKAKRPTVTAHLQSAPRVAKSPVQKPKVSLKKSKV